MHRSQSFCKAVIILFSAAFGLALFLLTSIPSVVTAQTTNQTAKADQSPLGPNEPIVFLGATGYPPYGFIENSTAVGANVDLIKALGKALGRPVDLRLYKWADAQFRFNNGEGHALVIGVITAERQKLYDFSQSTFTFEFMLFSRSERLEDFANLNLSNKRIAVTRGSYPQTILENNFPKAEIVFVDNMADGFQLLSKGEVDGAIEENLVGQDHLKRANLHGIEMIETPLSTTTAHIPVLKGNSALLEELNQAISMLKSSGKIKEISRKWLAGEVIFVTRSERYAATIGAVITLAIIAMLAILLFLITRKRIRERKQSEQALRESEQRFMALFHNSDAAIFLKDRNERYILVNKKYESIYMDSKKVIGKTVFEFCSKAIAEKFSSEDQMVLDKGVTLQVENKVAYKNGRSGTMLTTKFPIIGQDGKVEGVGGINVDITKRKRAEELFKALFEQSDTLCMILDPNTPDGIPVIVDANKAACAAHGYTPAEFIGRPVADIDDEEGKRMVRERTQQLIQGETLITENTHVRKDGTTFPVSVHANRIEIEGELPLIFTTEHDITERKQLEDKLRQSQRMEAVGQLTGGVAHDFNNILAVLIGNAEMLGRKVKGDKKSEHHISALLNAVDRASSLTNRLLAFSRNQLLLPVSANVNDLVNNLEELLHRTLGEPIEITTNLASDLWLARIDPHQFENALVNISLNGRDAMPDGGTISIVTSNTVISDEDTEQFEDLVAGNYVTVSISDSGDGMPPEVIEKAFEPFFTTKEVGKGSGLGLSMVYGFAKQSDGHAVVTSEVGNGTIVTLFLPRSIENLEKEGSVDETLDLEMGTERILVVEDDANVREISAGILRDQGYQIVEAGNGAEALEHLENGEGFDLLFTDVILPGGMNGVEIAKQAEKLQPNIKILYTTGYAENSIVQDGKLDRGITLVNKPYSGAELLEKVRTILDEK